MAKKTWGDGTHLTPSFMTSFFGTDANTGHIHNGANLDGKAPKIDLTDATNITGVLPLTSFVDSSTGVFSVISNSVYDPVTRDWTFERVADHVMINCSEILGVDGSNNEFRVSTGRNWPVAIQSTYYPYYISVPAFSIQNSSIPGILKPGIFYIVDQYADWTGLVIANDGTYISDGFGIAGGYSKGIRNCTLSYQV